jgi:FixJ family two-component response regulator
MAQQTALVSVVDDDESVRESLPDLLKELGFAARPFESAQAFLTSDAIAATQCLILDVMMPGMSGPQLQRELRLRKLNIPLIFMTAHRDPTLRAILLEAGATQCLFKPFSAEELQSALRDALVPAAKL